MTEALELTRVTVITFPFVVALVVSVLIASR